jgi:hypothetical protein
MTQHIFLHVPKTAGSSIRTLIQQNYPAEATIGFSGEPGPLEWYARSPRAFKEQYRLVHGHFPYGIHRGVLDYTYFTFLRDPVDRHFSDYFFLKRYHGHPMQPALASGAITLADWARIHGPMPMYRDMSTRIVSGGGDHGNPDRASIERSKYLLTVDFAFVGLSERFDESVLILAKRLGWRSVFYLTKNVSANRETVAEELRAMARTGLRCDLELYAYGRSLFEASPELSDPLFPKALDEYRRARHWLDAHVANDAHALFEVGFELPDVDALVRRHQTLPALDRFLGLAHRQAA